MSEKDAGDDWNDAHVIRKVVSRQQAVPAELMTAAQRGATSSKPDTDLDLDDVAATSPKAKAELEALRSENARMQEESQILRYLLAMSHEGKKHRIYGDDGELQCPTCWVDFVRDSAQDIKRKIEEAGMRELHRAIEAWDWPPKKVDLEN